MHTLDGLPVERGAASARVCPLRSLACSECGRLLQEPRHQIILLCFLATLVAYVERVGFSIAFTEMAKAAGTSEAVKGAVMSAFYWGYAFSQVLLLQHVTLPDEQADGCGELGPPCHGTMPSLNSASLAVYIA